MGDLVPMHASVRLQRPPRALLATPVLLTGGTEFQTLNLASVLVAAGWETTVCCYHESNPAMVREFESVGARVLRLGLSRRLGLIGVAGRLRAAFSTQRPDVIHVQYLAPGFTAVLAARAAGVRTVFATVHQPGSAYGFRERLLLRSAAHLCTAFFAVSKAVERSWFGDAVLADSDRPLPGRKHVTLYNAVDTAGIVQAGQGSERSAIRGEWGVAVDAPVVGFIGRVCREKGLDILIRALAEVVVCFPEVRLVVVGDGPESGALRDLAQSMKVAEWVVWTGMYDRPKVWRQYAALDLVAVPSLFEGFGLAAAEAQAAGLPVIAADVGGLREVVADGESGILFSCGDHRALAAAIARLIGAPELARKMGLRGRLRVEDQFSMKRFARATLAYYESRRSLRSER